MQELNNISEKIGDNRKNPFKVPHGYFDELPSRIQKRTSATDDKSSFQKFVLFLKPQMALAASIIAFAVISYSVINFIDNKVRSTSTPDIAIIMDFDDIEFKEESFLEILMEETPHPKEQIDEEVKVYMNYLINEDIDYGTLIDELED